MTFDNQKRRLLRKDERICKILARVYVHIAVDIDKDTQSVYL